MWRLCPIRLWLPLAMAGVCSGCLFTHHQTNMVRQDEIRREVEFESLAARQAFSARAYDAAAREKATKTKVVAIPFLLWQSRMDVLSDNAYYNDQVVACDTNGDGRITVAEAVAYSPKFSLEDSVVAGSRSDQVADAPMPESVVR